MKKQTVFITRHIHETGLKMLKDAGFKVEIYPKDKKICRKSLLAGARKADAILSLLTDKIDKKVFEAGEGRLKIVANYAVGYDNIDLESARRHKVVITNTPSDKVSEAVAEHAFALMLALARRIPEADHFAKRGKYKGWSPTLLNGVDLYGKTLGLIGAGRIGAMLARRAYFGFNMPIIYTDLQKNKVLETKYKAKRATKEALLKQADFVSLHVPLFPSTWHLISKKELKLMKKTAFLINTARGPVVDEKELLKALIKKEIAGAGLDVFECEPSIDCDLTDKLELKAFENVILTPHIASATNEAREDMAIIAVKNIINVLNGKKPITRVA